MLSQLTNLYQIARVTTDGFIAPKVEADAGAFSTIMNTVYLWAGIIAVLIIVVGGLLYVTSNGDPANITRAKNTILYAVIGLIIIIAAFTITQLVISLAG